MRVGDKFRTNPLSLKPGGSIVSVVFSDGETREYDKIKYPRKYVATIPKRDSIVLIYVDGKEVWSTKEKIKYWEQK